MKRFLLLVLPLLIIIMAGFSGFGIYQAKSEEEKFIDEIKRKAKAVAESSEIAAQYAFINKDKKALNKLAESFEKRERLQGCILYDKKLNVVAITHRIEEWAGKDKKHINDVFNSGKSISSMEKFNLLSVYSYIIPVTSDKGVVLGALEVIYDTSYVHARLEERWRMISIYLVVLSIFTVSALLLLQRQIFILPILQLTDWFKKYQKGEIDTGHPINDHDEYGKLASEVEQVALTLRIQKKSVSEEASKRIHKGEVWNEARLKDLVRAKFGDNAFFVVSNREPYMHTKDEMTGEVKCIIPAGGVVTALDPILKASGGTWFAHGAGNEDKKHVNSKDKLGVPPEDNQYILKRIWLTKEEEEGYYYGFSNEGLWPLCHVTHTRPVFKEEDWQMYIKANQKFADSIIDELPKNNPVVFIQDYHFTLLAKMIKDKRPDVTIALFWHIPWPNPEILAICPYYKDILEGMLACDIIGFHVQNHCNNFIDTVNRLIECRVDTEKFSVTAKGRETLIRPYPISVKGYSTQELNEATHVGIQKLLDEYPLTDQIVAVSVDRIDYTKGISERIMAIDRFLEKYPQYKRKFVFVQIGAPSRVHIKKYHDLIAEIDELVEKVNWKHADGGWKPIIYLKKHFSWKDILPLYILGDICVVSSLHDGMNLVAKEYIAAKKNSDGVLVLSTFTGAARELTDAVMVNPYSTEEFAEAIKQAVEMPVEEKRRRMQNMRQVVEENNVYRWAGSIISDIAARRKNGDT